MKTHRPALFRNAMHLGVGQVVTTTLAIVLSAVVSRTLGASDYGLLYLVLAIATFAYVFVDWGYGPYVVGEVARHPERAGDLLGSVLALRVATAAVMCVVAVLVMSATGYEWRTCLLAGLQIIAVLPQYAGLTYTWVFRGRERMEYDALLQIAVKVCALVFTVACLAVGGRVVALILVPALAGTITLAVGIVHYRRLRLSPLQVSASTARELVRHGAPMMALSLAIAAQPAIDANLLYRLAPAAVAGWYAVAIAIAGTLLAPAAVLGSAVYPRLSKVRDDIVEFRRVFHSGFRPLIFVSVLGGVGTFLFADFAVDLAYTKEKFGEGGRILRTFAPALILIYLDMLLGYATVARQKAGRLAVVKVTAVATTAALEFVLIPWTQARWGNGGFGVTMSVTIGELVMLLGTVALIRDILDRAVLLDLVRKSQPLLSVSASFVIEPSKSA
jgi:O-antigen/teichoic acid export membrane protein